jgi:hypothetical protein
VGTTYAQGDEVTDLGILYISLQSGNVGHTPASSATWWQPVAAGGQGQTPWLTNIDGAAFNLNNAGAIGVGTVSGPHALTVQSAASISFDVYSTNTNPASTPGMALLNDSSDQVQFGLGGSSVGTTSLRRVAFWITTRDIAFGTGATFTERMRITAAGDVGVGNNATPPVGTGWTNLIVGPTSASTSFGIITPCGNTATTAGASVGQIAFANYGKTGADKRLALINGLTDGAIDSGAIQFMTFNAGSPLERMRITAVGNVGIGTAGPYNRCTIADVSRASTDAGSGAGALSISSQTGAQTDDVLLFGVHTGDYSWIQAIKAGTATRSLALQPGGGNVGIGTTNPTASMHLTRSDGSYQLKLEATNVPRTYGIAVSGSGGLTIDDLTAGAARVFLSSAGNVGIGTTGTGNPSPRLESFGTGGNPATSGTSQAAGSLRVSRSGGSNVLDMGGYTTGPFGIWLQGCDYSNLATTYPLVLQPNGGNVGIGIITPGAPLHIATANVSDAPCGGLVLSRYWSGGGSDVRASAIFDYYQTSTSTERLAFSVSVLGNPYDVANVKMVLTQNGRVGIGQLSPGYTIDAVGDVNCTGAFRVNGTAISGITTQTAPARVLGTTYQNTTGKAIFVQVTISATNGGVTAFTDAANPPTNPVAIVGNSYSVAASLIATFWVLPNNYYRVAVTAGSAGLQNWWEWS